MKNILVTSHRDYINYYSNRRTLSFFSQLFVHPVANFFVWNVTWPPRVFKYLLIAVDLLSAQPIVYTMQVLCSAVSRLAPSLFVFCMDGVILWLDGQRYMFCLIEATLQIRTYLCGNVPCCCMYVWKHACQCVLGRMPVLRDHNLPTAQTRSSAPSRNIKPMRDFLRHDQGERTLVSWVSAGFVGNNNHSVVACAEDRIKAETRIHSSVAQTPLAQVMGFLPLRMAFGEFCRKALCSEVRRCIERCVYAGSVQYVAMWMYFPLPL